MQKQLAQIAYDVAKEKYGKTKFTFEQLAKDLMKVKKFSQEEMDEELGNLYVSLLESKKFIFVGKKQWGLRENYSLEEIAELENALYDFYIEDDVLETPHSVSMNLDDDEIVEEDEELEVPTDLDEDDDKKYIVENFSDLDEE